MRVLHINFSDIKGGAAIAMYRFHEELKKSKSVKSSILVLNKNTDDKDVYTFSNNLENNFNILKRKLSFQFTKLQRIKSKITHSLNIFDSSILKKILKINPDIIHLHWINNEMISIRQVREIDRIGFPIVWTMHDMWPYCGAEHYTAEKRFISGYNLKNKPKENVGIDLNRYIWELKKLNWGKIKFNLVSPSKWQFNNVSKSNLFKNKKNYYIPLGIDLSKTKLIKKKVAKKKLKLNNSYNYILFGSAESPKNNRKGFDILQKIADKNFFKQKNIAVIVFGNKSHYLSANIGIPLFYLGEVKENDYDKMGLIYSACDLTIVPSRMESFGLVALESLAHKRPVITFKKLGTTDLIIHKKNGFISDYLDTQSLFDGVKWYYNLSKKNRTSVNNFCGKIVKKNFNLKNITHQYINLYKKIKNDFKK